MPNNPTRILARADVPCSGTIHHILIRERGSLTLVHHAGKVGKHQRLITDSFTAKCGCTQWVTKWRSYQRDSAIIDENSCPFPFFHNQYVRTVRKQQAWLKPLTIEEHRVMYQRKLRDTIHKQTTQVFASTGWGAHPYEWAHSDYVMRPYIQHSLVKHKEQKKGARTKSVDHWLLRINKKEWSKLPAKVVNGFLIVDSVKQIDDYIWEVKAVKRNGVEPVICSAWIARGTPTAAFTDLEWI